MSINLVKGNKIRVLVAAPHNEVKNQTIEAWIERVKNFTYKNFNFKTDVLIVDNSESPKNKKWLMKQGVNCIHVRPKQKTNQKYIAESQDLIRTYALKMKYDFILFVETDVFPPHDIIERLLVHRKTVVSAMYMIEFGDKSHLMLQGIENIGGTIKNTINIDEGHDIQFVDGQLKEVYSAGLGCCFVKDTKVLDKERFIKNIQDVRIGDLILNHKGETGVVENTLKRLYKGDLILLKPKYFRKNIEVTPEHPILIVKKKQIKGGNNCFIKNKKIEPFFINASEIEIGDYVCYPKYKPNLGNKKKSILISDFIEKTRDTIIDGNMIYSTKSNSSKTKPSITYISKKYKIDQRTIRLSIKWYNENKKPIGYISEKTKNKVIRILKNEGFNFDYSVIKLKNKINLNPDFFEFYGYYMAEGSSHKGNVEFSFGGKEIHYANRIKLLTKKIFGLNCRIEKRDSRNVIRVVICSKILSDFMLKISGKNAHSKNIHLLKELILSGEKNIVSFLKSYINGDGHKNKYYVSMSTVSETLANNLKELFLVLGKVPTIIVKKPTGKETINGRKINCKTAYILSIYKNQKSFFEDCDYFYIPIKEIKKEKFKGYVYNLQVRNENTYCLDSFAVHNCLIHKSVLEKVKFRWEEGSDAHADSFLAGDLKFLNIKQFLDTGTLCEHRNSSWATITDRALK